MTTLIENNVVRAYQAESLECRDGERAVIARVNTGEVDRYRTVIEPAGIKLTNYQNNPTVLYEHGKHPVQGSLPVGKCQWIKYDRSANCLVAKAIFGTDPFSDQLFKLYQDGTLRAFSVNILPDEASPPTKEERRTRPELEKCEMVYRTSELAEFSAVSVPGNANALAIAVSRGLWVPDEIRKSLVLDAEPQMRGGDDAAQTQDEDEERGFDASTLSCTEKHTHGHCPKCGEAGSSRDGEWSCKSGHSGSHDRAIACPYKEAERLAPVSEPAPEVVLPQLSGRSFGEIHASLAMLVRSTRTEILKDIKEHIDLLHGRV